MPSDQATDCFEQGFGNITRYPRAGLRLLLVIVSNIYCILTYLIWMVLLLPLRLIHPETYYWIEGKLFHYLQATVAMWSITGGYDIVELGDDISCCLDQKTLVLVNHQSTADIPLLMTAFNTKADVLNNIMWIMAKMFRYTNFGIVSAIHKDFFIASGPLQREQALVELRDHLEKAYIPRKREWMVLFPEGGFLRKRREASHRYATRNNLPVLQHVTLPRLGAMKTIIDALGPGHDKDLATSATPTVSIKGISKAKSKNNIDNNKHAQRVLSGDKNLKEKISEDEISDRKTLKYVLDITIAYPDGKPFSLLNIVTGLRSACQTHVLYRLYRCSDVPRDDKALTKWMYDRFVEKEELLETFYNTGSFSFPSKVQPNVVDQDLLRFFFIHLFFIASSYLHFQIIAVFSNQLLIHLLQFHT